MSDNEKDKKILLSIGVNKDNVVFVEGDISNKKLNFHLLAEAIKIVADYVPAKIHRPDSPFVHRMMNFMRRKK